MVYAFEKDSAKLVFELKNTKPIELIDLSRSFNAVANQYRRFVIREEIQEEKEAKLYIKEVINGSTTVELFSKIQDNQKAIGEIISTSKSVLSFGKYLKDTYSDLSKGKNPRTKLTTTDV